MSMYDEDNALDAAEAAAEWDEVLAEAERLAARRPDAWHCIECGFPMVDDSKCPCTTTLDAAMGSLESAFPA